MGQRLSTMGTLAPPVVVDNSGKPGAAQIAQAGGTSWLRVLVRNTGTAGDVRIAYDSNSLQQFPHNANSYKLPAGMSDVFVLAPNQGLFVSTTSSDGTEISYSVSEALPADITKGSLAL